MRYTIFFIMLLLFSSLAHASVLGDDCSDAAVFDAGSVVKCDLETKLNIGSMTLINSDQFVMDTAKEHTLSVNIDPEQVRGLNRASVILASLLLFLVAVYIGYLYMNSGSTPKKRHLAKQQLINLIILAIVIPSSFFFATLFFDLSNEISTTLSVISPGDVEDVSTFFDLKPWADRGDVEGGSIEDTTATFSSLLVPSAFVILSGFIYNISMAARNIIIYAFFALCPFVAFLFLFQPSRSVGKFLLALMAIEFFIPILFVTVFKVTSLIISGITLSTAVATAQSHTLLVAAALTLCGVLHFIFMLVVVQRRASL